MYSLIGARVLLSLLITLLPAFTLATLYEDAEDGDVSGNVPPNVRGWFVYDNTPAGSTCTMR